MFLIRILANLYCFILIRRARTHKVSNSVLAWMGCDIVGGHKALVTWPIVSLFY